MQSVRRRLQVLQSHLSLGKAALHDLSDRIRDLVLQYAWIPGVDGVSISPAARRVLRPALQAGALAPLVATILQSLRNRNPRHTWPRSLANLAGLLSLEIMVSQAITGGRFPLVEKVFGHDKAMTLHRQLWYISGGLLSLHVAHKSWGKKPSYLVDFKGAKAIVHGKYAFWGMLIIPLLAYLQRMPQNKGILPWNVWKPAHYALYGVIVYAMAHAKKMGLRTPFGRNMWWLLAASLTATSGWRLVDRIRRDAVNVWRVQDVHEDTFDVTTVTLTKSDGIPPTFLRRQAGQFAILRTRSGAWWRGKWSDPHPFTISGAPEEGPRLRFTIKAMPGGRFSTRVRQWAIGEEILVEGPFGVFTPNLHKERNVVMVAGGVGITPFLSILRHAQTAVEGDITLIWGIKNKEDLMLLEEFQEMIGRTAGHIRIVLVMSVKGAVQELLTDPSSPKIPASIPIEEGFITKDLLERHAPGLRASRPHPPHVYLCGPPIMTQKLVPLLEQEFAIPSRRIHYEYFSW